MTSEISVWQHSPSKPPVRIDKGGIIPHGLSKADSDGWRLNLKATDNQLMQYLRAKKSKKTSTLSKSEFLANVNRQRAEQGITPPRGLEGQRNRAVSWRWIELLDITAFKVKRLYKDTDPERQSKRRARVMAQRLLPKYIEAIEEFEASPCRPTEKVRPKPLLAREG